METAIMNRYNSAIRDLAEVIMRKDAELEKLNG